EQTGVGQRVEVSLLGGQIWAQASELTHASLGGAQHPRANRGHGLIPAIYGIFPTSDGWIGMIGVPPHQKEGFCRALGRPEMIDDERVQAFMLTPDQRESLFADLDEIFKTRTTDEWMERMNAEQQRVARVNDYSDVLDDEMAYINGYLMEAEHPEWGTVKLPGSPVWMSDTPMEPATVTPELGQHTEEVLLEAGFSWEEITDLRDRGAWG
ncbi:MAG: CoA transferase, partial [Acidimicrobiales bacterium]